MYLTYTRHTVKDYAVWRAAFDANAPMLAAQGIRWEVVQVNGVPTDVAVLCRCPDKQAWDAFVAADTEKFKQTGVDPREKAGLVGRPEWWAGEVMP